MIKLMEIYNEIKVVSNVISFDMLNKLYIDIYPIGDDLDEDELDKFDDQLQKIFRKYNINLTGDDLNYEKKQIEKLNNSQKLDIYKSLLDVQKQWKPLDEIKIIPKKDWEEEFFKLKQQVAYELGYDLEELRDEEEDNLNLETKEWFVEKFGFNYDDIIKEQSSTGSGANSTSGVGEQYATPRAFGKKKKYKNSGYIEVNPQQRFKAKTFDVVNWKSNKPKYLK